MPTKRSFSNLISESADQTDITTLEKKKKLKRLPHVFSRVLELPFSSEAHVSVEERLDCFRFAAKHEYLGGDDGVEVMAHMVEFHPGVVKVVVRRVGGGDGGIDNLEVDMWRFRLPADTSPEKAEAACCGEELVVTVPKRRPQRNEESLRRNMTNLVIVN